MKKLNLTDRVSQILFLRNMNGVRLFAGNSGERAGRFTQTGGDPLCCYTMS